MVWIWDLNTEENKILFKKTTLGGERIGSGVTEDFEWGKVDLGLISRPRASQGAHRVSFLGGLIKECPGRVYLVYIKFICYNNMYHFTKSHKYGQIHKDRQIYLFIFIFCRFLELELETRFF